MSQVSTLPSDPTVSNTASLALDVNHLAKTYVTGFWMNKKIHSLKDCSLSVKRGETFGLLGPNGAGKTTTVKCLLGITQPSQGSGTILDYNLGDRRLKQYVGYLPENPYFYDYLTAWEILEFSGHLFQVPPSTLKERIPALLKLVGLSIDTARKKPLKTYSKGMLQRTGMAQALINDPELVFFDEPMSGLDPLGRYQIREIILSLKHQGKTVFFNSHILSDVEAICDRVALLIKGQLVCEGHLDDILTVSQTYYVKGMGGQTEQFREQLIHFQQQGDQWQGEWHGSVTECTQMIEKAQATLLQLQLQRQSLEDFFVSKVHAIQGDKAGESS